MNTWTPGWLTIGAMVALTVVAAYVAWISRKRLREAQRSSEEKQALFETVTFATQKVNQAAQAPSPAEEGPAELPPVDEAIVRALAAGECVLCAGSGVSAQAGIPVWRQTLATVIDQFEGQN